MNLYAVAGVVGAALGLSRTTRGRDAWRALTGSRRVVLRAVGPDSQVDGAHIGQDSLICGDGGAFLRNVEVRFR